MPTLPYVTKIRSDLANQMIIYFSEILRKKLHYPGILWFAPFVVVPAAMFPAPSTITIPETKQHINFNRPYHGDEVDAISTGGRSSQKLLCLYRNPMANNSFQN